MTVRYGDTLVLGTANRSDPRPGLDFFPLTVEFEERMYAAGKIPGGFIKREARASEAATLAARLTDRPIRPLFPSGWRHETQVIALVLSADDEHDSDVLAITGASASLSISQIPFQRTIAGVRVGMVDDEYIINPTYEERRKGRLDLVVAGSRDAIVMVEHIVRRLRGAAGQAHLTIREAAIEFTHPLAGSSAATIVIFAPLAFLSGVTGEFFKALSLTVAASLFISFLLAWLAVPLLAEHLLHRADAEKEDVGPLFQNLQTRYQRLMRRLAQTPLLCLGGVVGAGGWGNPPLRPPARCRQGGWGAGGAPRARLPAARGRAGCARDRLGRRARRPAGDRSGGGAGRRLRSRRPQGPGGPKPSGIIAT